MPSIPSAEPAGASSIRDERRQTVRTTRRSTLFAALTRYPTFRRLWFGSLAGGLGQWMQQVALGWLALTLTDSPFFVGLVGFMAGIPFLIVSLPAGVLIDRFDRRRVMLTCQALTAILTTLFAVDVLAGWVQPWHLLIAAFANGSSQAILAPTQQALVPSLVAREDLTNAVGLTSAGQNMTRVVGPSIAGAVIGLTGVGAAFLLQAGALVVAFALVAGVRLPPRAVQTGVQTPRRVFDGVQLIARRPDLRTLFLLACIPAVFVFPYIQFLSVFARDILKIGAGGLGLLMASSGAGAVAGSLLVAARPQRERIGTLLMGTTVFYGAVIIGLSASRSVYLSVPLLVLAGVCGSFYFSTNNAALQHRISDDVRGRVMGAYMLTWGLMPLGAMPMGIAADYIGTPLAVGSGALISSLLAAALGIVSRDLREL